MMRLASVFPSSTMRSESTFFAYASVPMLPMHGASQFPIWNCRHSFFGSFVQMRILKSFRRYLAEIARLAPSTKGPKNSASLSLNRPSEFLRASRSRGNFSFVSAR